MSQQYTAVIKKEGDWWIGWVEEIPGVNCQEPTREDLLESLRITLSEALLPEPERQGAVAMLGLARRLHPVRRSTREWMEDLRDGES
jgi:predicted RNase H-like HicB family nuclease